MFYTHDYTLVIFANETDFELNEIKLGEILDVPTDGLKTMVGKMIDAFMDLIGWWHGNCLTKGSFNTNQPARDLNKDGKHD
ncbi:hypothetical protein RND71_017138 [Anisodus tanguticus]|uniref:Uncharacterized protein n=1 Tax=Anisodus tanguticus TaxID=243964 RepID=A0AAE1VAQ5_9SOLA|nr:hypothetical protein RND71_017138 [Anisodus tanguticus]